MSRAQTARSSRWRRRPCMTAGWHRGVRRTADDPNPPDSSASVHRGHLGDSNTAGAPPSSYTARHVDRSSREEDDDDEEEEDNRRKRRTKPRLSRRRSDAGGERWRAAAIRRSCASSAARLAAGKKMGADAATGPGSVENTGTVRFVYFRSVKSCQWSFYFLFFICNC